ncbi:UDP-N-acetylenolpyruvoylglucosamine reductase [Candidatus Roizmanbacteria bacterium RIFCSPLOWO2_01_FULL_37_13]|uniref:UDP-N-acetylenolpyruvoylglucosamine reductase n=1 Tax=Candidatus Roizmanbacteria bacterium RIFCSPHIGHO2_02_FULL_38_11 TaxID=1802039 RepID=A0A1F7GY35_9BACT|nr:MAG: UDP-N-acetylenolpyruvoylglucosamine reductase [Candidatus Roizmanbacteria bacterium RIFCSPHIGHO2_02_FULL_38_11]OGK34220.1 MAG: UDP-N-acetylenolpyruvoylglucosamine reductase [Candidatus Roizmanbacteria bacterium RIFCSPHIGHO2_12_FULL_37_9b]OGK42358.1 MAG: UDP-N-acetylenolpyruvoylglucosamine reductase [Candidatus Roizmanbacteria bacterium RIFCSPLOWO2_01_FULL_37_13]
MTKLKSKLESILGKDRIKKNFNLSPYLTLRTETTAEYYLEAETRQDLINAKKISLKLKLPLFILGGGSNLAILKKKLTGLVVRNKYIDKKIKKKNGNILLTISSGYPVSKLAKELADQGYEGLEYNYGLPGTIGGALYMNSKWIKPLSYTGDNLISANLVGKKGKIKVVDRSYFKFSYDQSILQKTKEILLEAVFKLKKTAPQITKQHTDFAMKYRKQTQPFGVFTSGCFFKNINGKSAGKLIDQTGLKGKRVGKFHVSDKHANFIIHDGNGNPADLEKLLQLIKAEVKKQFGVKLEEEVIVI